MEFKSLAELYDFVEREARRRLALIRIEEAVANGKQTKNRV